MGTRSTTTVLDQDGKVLVKMYRQFDGYPEGHGEELREFLRGMKIVNGLGYGQESKIANGMGCLAAQMIAHFKTDPGGIYIQGSEEGDEQYNYVISYPKGVDYFNAPRAGVYPVLVCKEDEQFTQASVQKDINEVR